MNNPLKHDPIVVIDGSQGVLEIIADMVKAGIAVSAVVILRLIFRGILIVIGFTVLALGFWAGRHGWLYYPMGLDAQFFGNPAAAHPHHYTFIPKPFPPQGSWCDDVKNITNDQCHQFQSRQKTYCDEKQGGCSDRFIRRQDY
jgi:hypothetical protein